MTGTIHHFPLCSLLLCCFAGLFTSVHAEEENTGKVHEVYLYQSDEIHIARGVDVKALSDYILSIESTVFESGTLGKGPEVLDAVIAIRPGKLSRVWFVSSLEEAPDRSQLAEEIQSLESIEVIGGPIAIALRFVVGSVPAEDLEDSEEGPPLPAEWLAVLQEADREMNTEEILEEAWQLSEAEEASLAAYRKAHEFPVPDGFRLQMLEPFGGKVAMPKEWEYAGWQEGQKLVWLIAEDIDEKGGYETGMKIQFFIGMDGGKEAGQNFLKQQEEQAAKIHRKYDPVKFGMFTREGIQVESSIGDEVHRVVYSIFWTDDGRMLAVTSAGCPLEEWDKNADTLDILQRIELLDPEVVEKLASGGE